MKYYIVNAFTDKLFAGNPAGICLVDENLSAEIMQKIAHENNLSETAFITKQNRYYDLRWFTPKTEIDLCGHATLGSAFVITNFVDKNAQEIRFETKSGTLIVRKMDNLYETGFSCEESRKIGSYTANV